MFRALPRLPSIAPVSVGGFTRYKTQETDLPESERRKIDLVAERIVASFRPGSLPVLGILFVGHADQDLARGAAFEREVSLERAERAREAVCRAVQRRAGAGLLALQVKSVVMRTAGVGAAQRLFTHPINEPQRAANRRVVMFIAEGATPVEPIFDIFPVPRQKHVGTEPGPDVTRRSSNPSALVAFNIPILGSPPLAGAAVFVEGAPRRPDIKHDHGFLDDGKGNIDNSKRQSPTDKDRAHKEVWQALLGAAMTFKKDELKDANDAYKHFLVDNNGTPMTVRYNGFLTEDTNGKTVLASAIDDTRTGVLDVFDAKFAKPATVAGRQTLRVTSSAVTVGRVLPDLRYPYPDSENWQKAIGGHALWLSAEATIDSNPAAKTRAVEIKMTLHAEDMYNFNPGGADVATNQKDEENGRFEITGLGTEFLQTGTATRTITFTVPNAKQANNRVVPADQKVT